MYHGPGGGGGRGGEPEWVGEPESAHLDGEVDVVDGSVELGEAGLPLRDGGVSGDGLQWNSVHQKYWVTRVDMHPSLWAVWWSYIHENLYSFLLLPSLFNATSSLDEL